MLSRASDLGISSWHLVVGGDPKVDQSLVLPTLSVNVMTLPLSLCVVLPKP